MPQNKKIVLQIRLILNSVVIIITERKIEPYIEYYNIGVHGPDILFYYHSYCKNKVNQYGVKVHHEPAREFFKRAFKVF